MRVVHRRMLRSGFAVVLSVLILAVSCTGSPAARSTSRQSFNPTPAGQPPEVIASNAFLCPPGYGFGAYGSLFYPPTFPSPPPPSARPARCYPSSVEAEAAGYALAPTPEGDLRIGLVYLVPADHAFLAACRAGAARLDFPVPCPLLVPEGADAVYCAGNHTATGPSSCAFEGAFIAEGAFYAPGYVGVRPGSGHLWIMAARSSANPPFWLTCGERPSGSVMINPGVKGGWIDCPQSSEGNHAGHVLLVWGSGGITYVVSLHGHTPLNRSLDLAIARNLTYTAP